MESCFPQILQKIFLLKRLLTIITLLLPLVAFAQSSESRWQRFLTASKLFLDSTDVSGCDLTYVRPFKRPWTINLSIRQFGTTLKTWSGNGTRASLDSDPKINLKLNLAYRGYGLSYSHNLSNATEREFSLSKRGAVYGLEFRRYKSSNIAGNITGDKTLTTDESFKYYADRGQISKKSSELTYYYVFNHRTFSYPAAITGTVRQIRSCGSPILAAVYYNSNIQSRNDSLSYFWGDVRRIKIRQLSIGGGYGYNYVFGHNSCFLVHGSVMPMLSVYRRNKLYTLHSQKDIEEDSFLDSDRYLNYFRPFTDRNSSLKLTALFRFSFHYSWRNSIVGYRAGINRTDVGSSKKFRTVSTEWNSDLYVGYRF